MSGTTRSFVPTRCGTLHMASHGTGLPVLLLHQTPRSWDEYRDVLPLLGRRTRAMAMDTPGFGDSPALAGPPSIEAWSEVVLGLLDALDLPTVCLVGHHTGAVIAMEVAARAPERIPALVLSSCPMIDATRRAHHARGPTVDTAVPAADGSHLLQLWQGRRPFYPDDGIDLLNRFVTDALRAGPMAVEGHRLVNRYRMEDRVGLVTSPALVIAATADPHSYPAAGRVAAAIPGAEIAEIPGGSVPLPDAMPDAFAATILDFLRRRGLLT